MRALIIGSGSIGQRHLSNLRQLLPNAKITILRHDPSIPAPEEAAKLSDRIVYRLEDAFEEGLDFAVVASPAPMHVAVALPLAERGVHIFVEKPIADRLDGVDQLLDASRRHGGALLVGYVLRHHPLLQAVREMIVGGAIGRVLSVRAEVGQYLPEWRPASDYRRTVSARKDLGGGVLLELSHEIDYVRWLVGEPTSVFSRVARVGDLEIDVEDLAEIVLQFAGGALGSIHLDMVQAEATRTLRMIGSEGTIDCNLRGGTMRVYSRRTKRWDERAFPEAAAGDNIYLAQMRHFLECVAGRAEPCVTGEDGRRALRIALAAKESAQGDRCVELTP